MSALPTGTVTFLHSVIDGGGGANVDAGSPAPAAHERPAAIIEGAVLEHGGVVVTRDGGSLVAAFPSAAAALRAALDAQRTLPREPRGEVGPVGVRMALHTGEVDVLDGRYVGDTLQRCGRLVDGAHGGQVLLSAAVAGLVGSALPDGVGLRDLGRHRVRGFARPERIHQLVAAGLTDEHPPLRSLSASPCNLPRQETPFIGREQERAAITRTLLQPDSRLVSLTGPGGTGKTRLAIQVAADVLDRFPDGVCFVSLTTITDPGFVLSAIAQALDVREAAGGPLLTAVREALRSKQVLLVLDNFEHVVGAAATIVDLLEASPDLRVLVTSRAVLRLSRECEFPVPPLSLPTEHSSPGAAQAIQCEAVRLFVGRAQAARPDFSLTDENAADVAEICRRLDGLPLALELAAAQARLLAPREMLDRMKSRIQGSGYKARTPSAGRQTVRDAVARSYDLLDPAEQTLFRRLSVFAGGFTLERAEHICGGAHGSGGAVTDLDAADGGLLDPMTSLVELSLLQPLPQDTGEPRFAMLATIRELAWGLLEESGEAADLRRLHACYYIDLAESAAAHLHGPRQASWLDRLDIEHDELRAALAWCIEADHSGAMRLGGALWRFWQVRGHVREGRSWLERIIEADRLRPEAAGRERATMLNAAAFLAFMAGDYVQAAERYRGTLATRRQLGDEEGVAESLNCLGLVLRCMSDHDAADGFFHEALAVSRALGNRSREANILNNLARSAFYRGDHEAAQALHEQALSVGREAGDLWAMAICLGDLGDVFQARGDTAAAHRLYERSLVQWLALSDLRGVAQCLEGFAGLLAGAHPGRAVRLLGAAAAIRERIGEPSSLMRREGLNRTLRQARDVLGADRFAAVWSDGQAMSPEQAVEYARDRSVVIQASPG